MMKGLGNFLFKHRNIVFPLLVILMVLGSEPFLGDARNEAWIYAAGIVIGPERSGHTSVNHRACIYRSGGQGQKSICQRSCHERDICPLQESAIPGEYTDRCRTRCSCRFKFVLFHRHPLLCYFICGNYQCGGKLPLRKVRRGVQGILWKGQPVYA